MIVVTYEVIQSKSIFVKEEVGLDWRKAAKAAVPSGARVRAISACICEKCGNGSSLSPDSFICTECNSR